ncbi:MAG TPA: protein kinase [Bryobacteraceae bacterium]|nr:protein kinase [Bryobacteraceae bacterium]
MASVQQVGRYRIVEELGRGAMGVVYKAQDPAIGRVVAIKSIRLTDLTDEAERQRLHDRLFREAQSAGVLSHPNIVTIYDIAEEEGMAYIFMEYVNGPTLDRLLCSPQPPDRETLLTLLRQTAGALDYAHRKGIVHRDIKPANIMVHDSAMAKITDFGVARIASQQMTLTGTMMGTPNYMSPEQVEGRPVDGRADQYSLAVVAWEIFTGEKPFAAEHLPTLLYRIVKEDPPPLARLNPTLGPQVEAALRKALSKNPAERFGECTEFADALIKACAAKSDWVPMTHGAIDNQETMAGTAVAPAIPVAAAAPPPVFLPPQPEPPRTGVFRTMVWVLVGIGLVGLALIGAQRFLMNTPQPAESQPPAQTATVPPQQAPAGDKTANPAKPSPTGESGAAAAASTPPAATPPTATTPLPEAKPQAPPESVHSSPAKPAPVVTQPARPSITAVQIVTEPAAVRVVVDDNPSTGCTTPCMLQLPPGRHTLRADAAGFQTARRIFTTPDQSDLFLSLDRAMGTLTVSSNPPGATIFLNGKELNQKTPAVLNLAAGMYRVEIERDGRRVARDVSVATGEMHSLDLTLQ